MVQYALALPGTNAPVERIFSLMNDCWTDSKSQLKEDVMKSMLILRTNFNCTCQEFHNMLSKNQHLLNQIHSSAKYGATASNNPDQSERNAGDQCLAD